MKRVCAREPLNLSNCQIEILNLHVVQTGKWTVVQYSEVLQYSYNVFRHSLFWEIFAVVHGVII